MKLINSNLKLYIKNMSGNLLGIGIKDKTILKIIDKNDSIKNCDLLNCVLLDDDSDEKSKKQKKIQIKKIRKIFKYKRFDYIVVNLKEIEKFLKTFIRDSIYINKIIIYIYVQKDYDYSRIKTMYKRYNTQIKIEKCKDGDILIIDTTNSKDHKIKNKLYYLYDLLFEIFDKIGDFLVQ